MTDDEFTEWVASGIDRLLAAGIAREALTEKLECEIAAGHWRSSNWPKRGRWSAIHVLESRRRERP